MNGTGDLQKTQTVPPLNGAAALNEPRLVAITGPIEGAIFPLQLGDCVVGRSDDNAICLPSPEVSKTHCQISREKDGIFILDLNSTNGTFVNGRQLADGMRQQLTNADNITVFDTTFVLICPPPADDQDEITINFESAVQEAERALRQSKDIVELRRLRKMKQSNDSPRMKMDGQI